MSENTLNKLEISGPGFNWKQIDYRFRQRAYELIEAIEITNGVHPTATIVLQHELEIVRRCLKLIEPMVKTAR